MNKDELRTLNETLKRRPLTNNEWELVDRHVSSKSEDYLKEMAAEFPLLAMKYMPGKVGYSLFLEIACKNLNESRKFIENNYRAKVQKGEMGDGSGICMVIEQNGLRVSALSAMEDYFKSIGGNGGRFIYDFVEKLLEAIPGR